MRNRRVSAIALVTALHGEKPTPSSSFSSSSVSLTTTVTTSVSANAGIETSCSRSTMHHRVRLRATPTVEDHSNLPRDLEEFGNKGNQPYSPRDSTSLEITHGNHEENTPDHIKGNEAALAVFLLNVVAILWGTQHAVIKMVVEDSSAAPFTLLRFALAALIASPYTPGLLKREGHGIDDLTGVNPKGQTAIAWRWGAEMGTWMFLGFSFQALGLETTTAQRSGFLLYLNVKFVPFFSRVLLGRQISIPTWASALAAFIGTALLATDGHAIGFNIGDLWSIAAAAASAMYIIRLEKAAAMVKDVAQLNAACLWVVACLAAVWTFGGGHSDISETLATLSVTARSYPLQILYLGAVTTTLANYIQSKGQQYISPERASILYSLDPVYGAFFSWFLLGENIGGPQSFVGAGIITAAAATNAFLDFGKKDDSSSSTRIVEYEQKD